MRKDLRRNELILNPPEKISWSTISPSMANILSGQIKSEVQPLKLTLFKGEVGEVQGVKFVSGADYTRGGNETKR